jgi:hypothetical protein
MGTQDDLGQAEDFVARHATTTPLMTWDPGFDTWEFYGVRGQPNLILLDAAGNPIGNWRVLNDGVEAEILDLL